MSSNLNGQQKAQLTAGKLEAWLELNEHRIPRLGDGKVNKSALARIVGFDRQAFTTNPKVQQLLALHDQPRKNDTTIPISTDFIPLLKQRDEEIQRLRALVGRREVEIAELRNRVRAADHFVAQHEAMVATMRHIKPRALDGAAPE